MSYKIAFLGNFEVSYSSETHHAKSLEKLGHEVIRLQEREPMSIFKELPDIFVWIHTHGWMTPGMDEVIKQIKGKIPIVSYHLDLWKGLYREKDLETDLFYKLIDHWFVTDKLMADWLNENTDVKGHYLPAGVFEEETVMLSKESDIQDIIFVGSKGYHHEWPYRPQLINWLSETYGNSFGHYSGEHDALGLKRGLELNQLYADAKVVVGDSLCLNFDYPWYWSDRVYETTGRGGFLIIPYIKGLEDNFELGREIVTYPFGDFDQLKTTIDYYLDTPHEREAIRKAGFERTKRDHTYLSRWEYILRKLNYYD